MSFLFDDAIKMRASQALETPESAKAIFSDMPRPAQEMIHKGMDALICPSVSLHTIPQPKRPWSVPYYDEHKHVHVKASL